MDRAKMAQKQVALAKSAQEDPERRFTNLYSLLHWDYWIHCAADAVLARPGQLAPAIAATTLARFKARRARQIAALTASLRRKTYEPQPVRQPAHPQSRRAPGSAGMPALLDCIVQEALRAALQPIYEVDMQPCALGLARGRSSLELATSLIPLFSTYMRHYYVITGTIRSGFGVAQRRKLLGILRRRIADRAVLELLWKLLRAGAFDHGLFAGTQVGMPQAGPISPLLADIYLNELDRWAREKWRPSPYTRQRLRQAEAAGYVLVRQAGELVVASNAGIAEVEVARQEISGFLWGELRLQLCEEQTAVAHVNDGFDFLEFHFRRAWQGGRWQVHLRPSARARRHVKQQIKQLTSRDRTWLDEYTLLSSLNSVVRGWAEHYQHPSCTRDIEEVALYVRRRYLSWLLRKHTGSRKRQLSRDRRKVIHGRARWTARASAGAASLETYQWLPTRGELQRAHDLTQESGALPHEEQASGHGSSSG